jgi:hypothetical protein
MNLNLSMEEINALPDGATKTKLLDSYNASKGIKLGDELEEAVKPAPKVKVNLADEAYSIQQEKNDYYTKKLNPHKNAKFMDEALDKEDISY